MRSNQKSHSIDAYLLEEQSYEILSPSDLKCQSLSLFRRGCPNNNTKKKKKKKKKMNNSNNNNN